MGTTATSLAASPFANHFLYPTSAGVAGKAASCGMNVSDTIIAYSATRANTTRFVFVKVTNPTDLLGEVDATILLPGKEVTALREGIIVAYVPPHQTTWAHIYSDSVRPGGTFLNVNGVSIGCTPFKLPQ